MIVAKGPPRLCDETTEYFDGTNQRATIPLAAKKMLFVNGLRELKLETKCSRVIVPEFTTRQLGLLT